MNTHRTALVTDSTCDIPQASIEKHHIRILPQRLIWGEETFRDRIDITPAEFYQRLENDDRHPKTTLPAPETIREVFQKEFQRGADSILVFTVSSQMSGTYQLVQQIAEDFQQPIEVIDSRGPSMSLGWQVLAAARRREAGGDRFQMIQAAAETRSCLVQVVFMDTLKYLHKGGRIGRAAMLLGSLLDFKPLVSINHEQGIVEAAGRVRTREKGLAALQEKFFSHFDPGNPLHVAVLHGNVPGDAERLAQEFREQYSPQELLINITGPVLGVNTGPGALALCGYSGG